MSNSSPAKSSLYNWVDVTNDFKSNCQQLKIGELVKEDHFGLFEAMSAIEMMDPKMDAGMLLNQTTSKIKSFQQAINDKLIKIDEITFEEKLAIVDNTLCNLTTWLDGASLAQTLFTNLYLHDPNLIQDNYIKCFSVAILKITNLMRNKIITAGVFEEEDFQLMNYSFKFAPDFNDQTTLSSLKTAEDNIAKNYRHLKSELKPDSTEKDKQQLQVDLAHALWIRMKFVRCLFQILNHSDEHASFTKSSDEIIKHINNCLEVLPKIKETNKLGIQPEFVKNGKTTYPVVMGFEPTINQRLLPPTFPRFIKIQSFDLTVENLTQFLTQLNEAIKITELKSYHQIFEFALNYSTINQSVLLRSYLQLIVLPSNSLEKILKLKEILLETIQKFISPPILNQKITLVNKDVCIQLVDNFLNKCTPVFANLLQIMGHNKARQREKLGHILEDFAGLQEEADNLDRILHSFFAQQKIPINHLACIGCWLLYNSLTIMNLYILSGFELELFSKSEYHYIYWYLGEIVLNWQINTLNRVDNFLMSMELNLPSQTKSNKKQKKKTLKSTNEKEIAILTAKRHMYSAYYQSMKAFKLDDYIKFPDEQFDCEEFRYNHRFMPFQFFNTPPIFMFHHFKEKDDEFVNNFIPSKMYSMAQEHFEAARTIFEKYSDYQSSSKIAKINFVVMRLLSSGLKKAQNLEIDFTEHSHFPVFRI